jgi:predicted O-methyltransferase YrrM
VKFINNRLYKRIDEIMKLTNNVEGWLSVSEGKLLYDLAKKCKGKGVIVEIGSWRGKSTIWLGCGSRDGNNVEVFAIDTHRGSPEQKAIYGNAIWTYEDFKRNISDAELNNLVIPIISTSELAAKSFKKHVELIFIDGNHDYDFVKKDYEMWYPKVIYGGIMAFHDTITWPGPTKVIFDSFYNSNNFADIRFNDSITYARKVSKVSFVNKLDNKIKKSIKIIYNKCRIIKFFINDHCEFLK